MTLGNPESGKTVSRRAVPSEEIDKKEIENIPVSAGYEVFVSHSRNDPIGLNFFKDIFTESHTKGFFYSDHNYLPPHANRIIAALDRASSMFVILSPEMETPHTSRWISFEVGVAKAQGKNVWVFEDPANPAKSVGVLGADAYIQRPTTLEDIESYGFMNIIDTGGLIVPKSYIKKDKGGNYYWSTANNYLDPEKYETSIVSSCSKEGCRQVYFRATLKGHTKYLCPACRRPLNVNNKVVPRKK